MASENANSGASSRGALCRRHWICSEPSGAAQKGASEAEAPTTCEHHGRCELRGVVRLLADGCRSAVGANLGQEGVDGACKGCGAGID